MSVVAEAGTVAAPRPTLRQRARSIGSLVTATPSMTLGLAVVAIYVAVALVSLVWTPFDPDAPAVGTPFSAPDATHWFGTDRLGSDVFSRTMVATRLDLLITISSVAIALVVGTVLGVVAGTRGGWIDGVVMRGTDILQSFPSLLLAMLTVVALGAGAANVVVVLAFVGLPYYLRLARAEIIAKRSSQFADAARLAGNSTWAVSFRHLLPNSLGPILAYTSVNSSWVVLVTASLGYLGVGIEPGRSEWGAMISRGQAQITTGEWWISLFPGLAVLGLSAAFYLLGDGLRDINDPKGRR
ncbi:MAG: ABC transporter permease [Actinomycetota bacterium]|nr:ABC transporter permease [Actinomycetota bacterium]